MKTTIFDMKINAIIDKYLHINRLLPNHTTFHLYCVKFSWCYTGSMLPEESDQFYSSDVFGLSKV